MTAHGVMVCPHCGITHDGVVSTMCADKDPWTRAERDEWRNRARKLNTWIQFAPSTAIMQDRFGARNRADRLAS